MYSIMVRIESDTEVKINESCRERDYERAMGVLMAVVRDEWLTDPVFDHRNVTLVSTDGALPAIRLDHDGVTWTYYLEEYTKP